MLLDQNSFYFQPELVLPKGDKYQLNDYFDFKYIFNQYPSKTIGDFGINITGKFKNHDTITEQFWLAVQDQYLDNIDPDQIVTPTTDWEIDSIIFTITINHISLNTGRADSIVISVTGDPDATNPMPKCIYLVAPFKLKLHSEAVNYQLGNWLYPPMTQYEIMQSNRLLAEETADINTYQFSVDLHTNPNLDIRLNQSIMFGNHLKISNTINTLNTNLSDIRKYVFHEILLQIGFQPGMNLSICKDFVIKANFLLNQSVNKFSGAIGLDVYHDQNEHFMMTVKITKVN
jgi:hypothetical protein